MYWEPILSFAITFILTPIISDAFKKSGIIGKDIHKPEKPEIPEMGGITVIIGVLISSSLFIVPEGLTKFLNAIVIISLIGILGIIDDLTNIDQSKKVLLSIIVSIPIINSVISTKIDFIFFSIEFGPLYLILAIIALIGASNAINMLAGFNGLEVGLSLIIISFLTLLSYLNGHPNTAILGTIFTTSILALLYYNIYPATIFPGDTGTLTMGSMIAIIAILGKVEIYGAILILPHIIDFLLKTKIKYSGKQRGPTQVNKNGKLSPPPYLSVPSILIKLGSNTEKKLIITTYLLEIGLGILTIILYTIKTI